MSRNLATDWIIYSGYQDCLIDSLGFFDSCPVLYPDLCKIGQRELSDIATHINEVVKAGEDQDDFFIGGKTSQGKERYKHGMFRVHRAKAIIGHVYELRRIQDVITDPRKLGLPRSILAASLNNRLAPRGGLLLWVGAHAHGKTTSCSSILRERLKRHGGFALTIENPPEIPLHGKIGEHGYCMQTAVEKDNFGEAMSGAMRCFPVAKSTILFLGEIRDPETAYTMLNYAGAGYLVMTTIHGGSIGDGLQRISSLADTYQKSGDGYSNMLLSQCFRMAVHQKMHRMKIISADALLSNEQVKSNIAKGEWNKLVINIEIERARINNNKDLLARSS